MMDDTRHKGQVTDRLPDAETPVTDRLADQSGAVTDRLQDADSPGKSHPKEVRFTDALPREQGKGSRPLSRLGIKIGELVADRYHVEEGPLGPVTGEAEIFHALDQQTEMKVVLKFYLPNVSPKTKVLDQLVNLDHPHIVSLKDYGEWAGRFFEVMELCQGGNLVDFIPYAEEELKRFIKEIINGLKYCHDQGIIHRDIKPNNLFFREPNKKDVVIADFGISSILTEGENAHITITADSLTPDYAAPELILNQEVSNRTDYYALGVTLIHFLMGQSPFNGMNRHAIYNTHFQGKVPLPEGMSNEFRQLLNGLLRVRPQNRWGYRQSMSWLHGQPILTDEGQPDRDDIYEGREHPYPECKEANNPLELARHLEDFDAENALFRGRISDWVYLHFDDAELAKRIEEIEEDHTDKKKLGVFKLRYTLDPTLPLRIVGYTINTIEDLVKLFQTSDESLLLALEEALWGEFIECWIDATIRDPRTKELVEKIKSIRTRLKVKNRRLAVFALLYTLDPLVPLKLADGVTISQPGQLEDVLAKKPDLLSVVEQYLYGGQFEEWMRAAFPDRTEDHTFIFHCKNTYREDKEQGVFALRWHFKPSLPFPYDNKQVTEPKELAVLIDRSQEDQKRGINLLSKGWIRTWLKSTRKNWESDAFDKVVNESGASWERKMEAILHFLDPDLPWPTISADRNAIKLGKVGTESSKTVQIMFSNASRGFLSGSFKIVGSGQGFSVDQLPLEGGPVTLKITVNPQGLPTGSRQKIELLAETNGGRIEIPILYRVAAPLWKMIGRSLGVGFLCAFALGIYRLIIQESMSAHYVLEWYNWDQVQSILNRPDVIIWTVLLVGIIGGGIYYLIRMSKIHGEN